MPALHLKKIGQLPALTTGPLAARIEERGLRRPPTNACLRLCAIPAGALRPQRRVGQFGWQRTDYVSPATPHDATPVIPYTPRVARRCRCPFICRILIPNGQTKLSYTAPAALAARYGVPDDLAAPLGAVNALTDAVIAG